MYFGTQRVDNLGNRCTLPYPTRSPIYNINLFLFLILHLTHDVYILLDNEYVIPFAILTVAV